MVQACEQVLWWLSNIKVLFSWLFIYDAHVLKRSSVWFHMTRLRCITNKMRNIIEQMILERYVGSKISKAYIVVMKLFMKAKLSNKIEEFELYWYKESKQSIREWDMVCCICMVSNWLSLLVMKNIWSNGFHSKSTIQWEFKKAARIKERDREGCFKVSSKWRASDRCAEGLC